VSTDTSDTSGERVDKLAGYVARLVCQPIVRVGLVLGGRDWILCKLVETVAMLHFGYMTDGVVEARITCANDSHVGKQS
jgi:hypothetical protein